MQIGARTTGSVVRVFVTTGGTGYTEPPVVTIAGGSGVTAHAHLNKSRVAYVAIGSGGTGFTASPSVTILPASTGVTISSFTAGTASGTVTLASPVAATYARIAAGTSSATISSFASATQAVVATTAFASSGAATVYAAGTGAAATAFAYTGPLRPMSFFKGRFNDVYGVDGMGRGFRWNGTDASVEKLGLQKPAVGPAVAATTSNNGGYLTAVQLVQGGAGYHTPPTVTISGGSATRTATARAVVANGRVTRVIVTDRGAGYQSTPTVSLSGGIGSGAAFTVSVLGKVSNVEVIASGRGYTTSTSCTANSTSNVFSCVRHGLLSGSTFSFSSLSGPTAAVSVNSFTAGVASGTLTLATAAASTWGSVSIGANTASILSFSNATQAVIDTPTFPSTGSAVLHSSGVGLTTGVQYYAVSVGANTFTAATTEGGTTSILTNTIVSSVITIPPPRVSFATTGGLTDAFATVSVDADGGVGAVSILSSGTGLTASKASASVIGGAGTGAILAVQPEFSVSAVSVANGGSGFHAAPVLTFRASPTDPAGFGAAATVTVGATGTISGVSMVSGGRYFAPPTALILNTEAKAQATVAQPLTGKYQCAIRYLDDTPETERGPIPSSISELAEISVTNPSDLLTWTFSHYGLDDRVHAMELWRTTADQSVALYRVATILRSDPAFSTSYTESLSDPDLQDVTRSGFAVMPIVLPSGQINARRFGVLPGDFAVAAMFQDRAWFAVDTSGDRPNSLLYSEIDEPESVPPENELVLQENTPEPDKVVGLIPLGSQLLVAQSSHLYALSYVAQPIIDASLILVAYRGMLNAQCGDVVAGMAVMADSYGMYAFDGNNTEAVSVPVDNYWRDGVIDFSQSSKFHVRADSSTMTVRFFYCRSGDTAPVRALCYCLSTKAWWEETYPVAVTAACQTSIGNKSVVLSATATGSFLKSGGLTDSGTAVPYSFRSGNLSLADEPNRAIGLVYRPTATTSNIDVSLHYNNSSTARPNAIASNPGSGFIAGSTASSLNMSRTRSALGDASGFAQAPYSGRVDDRSAGTDRHLAVAVSGEQAGDAVALYAIRVTGVN
jgi:hypothetical protein